MHAIAAWPGLEAEPQLHRVSADLARQPSQGRRRVRNRAVFPGLAAHAVLDETAAEKAGACHDQPPLFAGPVCVCDLGIMD